MSFKTTEAHEAFRAEVRKFAEAEVKPNAFAFDQDNEFPAEAVKKMGKLGYMGIPFPKKYGGMGLDNLSYIIAVEELSRADGTTGVIHSVHTSLCAWSIYEYGTEEQKKKYLVPLSDGKHLGAFGLTEPNAGSDAGGTETTAVLVGDHYILNGEKIFITNATKANTYVIFCVTTPDIGTRGISALIVENGWEGFTFGLPYDKLGIRGSTTAQLNFNDVKVPKENLLGKEGDGFKIAMTALDGGRIGIGAQGLGIAQCAFEAALEYAKMREQFGQTLVHQQVIQFKLADMATKLHASRMMLYRAASMKDHKEPYAVEAAMAKKFATDLAMEVTYEALQIHGGAGFMKGADVERCFRDARITPIYEGTNEIQNVVIAASLVGKLQKGPVTVKKLGPATGDRKKIIFKEGDAKSKVDALVAALKTDGHDFTVGIDIDTPIVQAERVVSIGRGIGEKKNVDSAITLAKAVGAALGSSRPVAETLRYVPMNRYVGMSGQKFQGNLYFACGISGAGQHLKGIRDAGCIVAINIDPGAAIFKNCDYGIVADLMEIMPLLTAALDTGEKKPAPPMVRMKRAKKPTEKKQPPKWELKVCSGCGYEYIPDLGDEEGGVQPGTLFEKLPDEWTCPECGEAKDQFIVAAY